MKTQATPSRADLRSKRDQLASEVASFATIALLNGDDAIAQAMMKSYLVQFLEADADYCADLGLEDLSEKQRNRAAQLKLTNK
jgi:hypothetical protein